MKKYPLHSHQIIIPLCIALLLAFASTHTPAYASEIGGTPPNSGEETTNDDADNGGANESDGNEGTSGEQNDGGDQGSGEGAGAGDELAPSISSFTAEPQIFSPNNDGTKDTTIISATFSETATATLKILNEQGDVLYVFYQENVDDITVPWDGLDDLDAYPDDMYFINLTVVDTAGNPASDTTHVVIDTISPTTTLTINGEENTHLPYFSEVELILDTEDASADILYNLDSVGWLPYIDPIAVTTDGTYTLEYYSTDQAGNQEYENEETFTLIISARNILETVFTELESVDDKNAHKATQMLKNALQDKYWHDTTTLNHAGAQSVLTHIKNAIKFIEKNPLSHKLQEKIEYVLQMLHQDA